MQVLELIGPLQRMGWDSEVMVSINGVEHRVLEFKEGVLGRSRAILIIDPEPDTPPARTKGAAGFDR